MGGKRFGASGQDRRARGKLIAHEALGLEEPLDGQRVARRRVEAPSGYRGAQVQLPVGIPPVGHAFVEQLVAPGWSCGGAQGADDVLLLKREAELVGDIGRVAGLEVEPALADRGVHAKGLPGVCGGERGGRVRVALDDVKVRAQEELEE